MASFSAGTTFTDGVANDVTAAKLGALVNNATPTSGLIQDRTAETITATNDTLLIGDASDSNALKRITVANFAQTLPTAKITTGTIETGTFGTTTSTAATITTGTITTGVIPTLTSGTTTSTAATITTGTIPTLVATTLITSGTGTAAAPAIVPTGDTNTGVFFPAADTAAIATQGTEAMRVDSSGRVGIGTTTPGVKLHISSGSADAQMRIESTGGASYDQSIHFKDTASDWYIGNKYSGATNSFGVGRTQAKDDLVIDSSGNVGINTSSPDALLDVKRTNSDGLIAEMGSGDLAGDVVLEIKSADSRASINIGATGGTGDASRNLAFSTSGTERLRIDSSGNVGIGTTSPLAILDVVSSSASFRSRIRNTTGNEAFVLFQNSDAGTTTSDGLLVGIDTAENAYLYNYENTSLIFGTNGTERLRIDSSGFVSIGTATALSALHVHGNVTLSNTTTATSAGTGGISKPGTYAGYLTVSINGTSRKIPYYAT